MKKRIATKSTPSRSKTRPRPADRQALRAVELMFFAYRDFTSDPDELLREHGFGRAHHRVLHFVGRDPGMTVTTLLGVLKITKQSLNRVLQQLVSEGFVRQKAGTTDRRQRCLSLTPKGERLWNGLRTPQLARFRRAFSAAGADAVLGFEAVLVELLNEAEREDVLTSVHRT